MSVTLSHYVVVWSGGFVPEGRGHIVNGVAHGGGVSKGMTKKSLFDNSSPK